MPREGIIRTLLTVNLSKIIYNGILIVTFLKLFPSNARLNRSDFIVEQLSAKLYYPKSTIPTKLNSLKRSSIVKLYK